MSLRVVQWATGAMGKTCLRAVIDRPDLELVGLFVYGDRKAGKDAGEIARRPQTGVIATQSVDEIVALEADVVIHAARLDPPFERHDDDILRLLASGKNVVSINGGTYPMAWPLVRQNAYQRACIEGGSSFMGAGLNPGFAAEKMLAVATGVCIDVQAVQVRELVDCRAVKSPEYVFDVIGFGAPTGSIDPNDPSWTPAQTMNALFQDVVAATAERLGWSLDGVRTGHSLKAAQSPLQITAGEIAPGGAARIDWRWLGEIGGVDRIDLGVAWTMEPPGAGGHEDHEALWRIRIEGAPNVALNFDMELPAAWPDRTTAEQLGVAGGVVNTLALVCQAAPGLHPTPIAAPWRNPHQRTASDASEGVRKRPDQEERD